MRSQRRCMVSMGSMQPMQPQVNALLILFAWVLVDPMHAGTGSVTARAALPLLPPAPAPLPSLTLVSSLCWQW